MTQECNIDKIINALSDLMDRLNAIKEDKVNNNEQPSEIQSVDQPNAITPSKEENVNNNAQPSEIQTVKKRPSLWPRVKKLFMVKTVATKQASESGGGSSRGKQNIRKDEEDANLEIQRLMSDILQMKTAFEKLTRFQKQMSKSLESTKRNPILESRNPNRSRSHDLKEIRRNIFNLKCQIPSLLLKQSTSGLSNTESQTAEEIGMMIDETGSDIYLPGLHVSERFKSSSAFEEVIEKFKRLGFTQKLCLLSFSVFPEDKEVKRTMLMYWWIGEGFLDTDGSENAVITILDELSAKGLLEPVDDERKLTPNSYKMDPHVHSAVVYLAEKVDLFVLHSEGNLVMRKSGKDKVCLVRGSSLQPEAKASKMIPEKLQTVFNSSERFPDFTFKWFPKMDSLRVLYLGRWERTAKRHIEVESTESLKHMKGLKSLKLVSFQGISRIEKLENYICSLPNLVILDLRACYNLEVLPEDIGLLEKLVYLDVSECFMLDGMPKGIARLSELRVLKGFVIGQSDDERNCAVKHLVKLRKLTITVNKYLFKVENLMVSLGGLEQLESLKIAWGARFSEDDQRDFATKKKQKGLKEQEEEQVQKRGDEGERSKGKVGPEDEVGSKKEEGRKENAYLEEGMKHEEVKAEVSRRSDGEVISKKEDGRNENADLEEGKKHADLEEGKKHEEEKAEVVEGEKKASPSQQPKETIQNKTEDQKGKSNVEEDGDKRKADQEKGKMQDVVEAEKSKSDKGVEGEKKRTSPDTVQEKTDDKSKVEKEADGDKGKANVEKGKQQDEAVAEKSKPDNGVEGIKKAGPSRVSADDHQKGEKQESSKPHKIIEGGDKTNPQQGSKDEIQSKPDDHKVDEKGGGGKHGEGLQKPDGGEAEAQKKPDKTKKLGKKAIHETPSKPGKTAHKESGIKKAKLWTAIGRETKKLERNQETTTIDKLPSSLKKLELECFPEKDPPSWLHPENLDKLEKLYIKGGKLSKISNETPTAENNCCVQILRLKYLNEFQAEWKDLRALFPQMILLEKYQCPKVAFCPTDGNGIWRSQPQTPPDM